MSGWILVAVDNVELARLQFATTSIFHFLFVPVTIGLAFLTAVLQTKWHRSGDEDMLRATRFFGVLLLINIAVGVVTGLVQEFQFGMNWSSYSRFVGDVFGAPLALHVILAALVTGSVLMLAVSVWHLRRKHETATFHATARLALLVLAPTALLAVLSGSELGVVVTQEQPMKIAAAEALWDSEKPASFSLFQIGGFSRDDQDAAFSIEIPYMLSFLATRNPTAEVEGINQIQARYEEEYGPGEYAPHVVTQYWSMRIMAYLAGLTFLISLWGLWLLRRERLADSRWFARVAVLAVVLPFAMNTAGWVLTEMGRQPWIVQGLQFTVDGVSGSVGAGSIILSLIVFVLLYGTLAIVDLWLMLRFARRDLPPAPSEEQRDAATASIVY